MSRWIRLLLFAVAGVTAVASAAFGLAEAPGSLRGVPALPSGAPDPPAVVFRSEAMQLTAVFGDGEVRLLLPDGRDLTLPQAISASGARYTDGSILFWNKGDEARLELDGVTYLLRVDEAPFDPWERAKRAGFHFRAVGQEPGWFLEIRDGERIHLTLDYGETLITTPVSLPEVDPDARTATYRNPEGLSPLDFQITIEYEPCRDPMNGELFPATVTVEFPGSGRAYSGCGRPLH